MIKLKLIKIIPSCCRQSQNKQHLSKIWGQKVTFVRNVQAELKKPVAYQEGMYIVETYLEREPVVH